MRYYLFLTLLIPFNISAQSLDNWVIGSGGESSVNPGIQLSWTLGEPNTATISKDHLMVTEGFHQSYLPQVFFPAGISVGKNFSVQVFPNPAFDLIQIHFADTQTKDFELRLLDLHGKMLQYHRYQDVTNAQLNVKELPAATYLLSIQSKDTEPSLPQTFQIIKH